MTRVLALTMAVAVPATVAIYREARATDTPTVSVTHEQSAATPAATPIASKPAVPEQPKAAAEAAGLGQAVTQQPASAIDTPPPEYKVVLARVGKETITVPDYMKYMTQDTRLVQKSRNAGGRAELLREMILDRLLEEAMRQEGLLPQDRTPDAKEYMQAYQKLAGKYFSKFETPSEEALYQYYEKNPELYGIPSMVRIGQIQFQVPDKADEKTKAAAKAKAEDALKRLKAGEPFAALAEALTDNPQGRVAKGDLGFFQPDKDEWLRKAVEGLAVGQISEVLESPVGYEILLLQDKRDAMLAPYRNVRDNVVARMQQEAQAKAREEYAWKIAKKIGVSVEKPELKSAIPASVAADIKAPDQIKDSEAKSPVEAKP
ncbi:MAG: peptidylprolyl isomerase [Candidatus Competibacter sp.]|nr:peptidylprolyl isomerase [Candidatus Competibacter sp.]